MTKNFSGNRFPGNERGQGLVEYALMVCFVTFAATAIMPGVATGVHLILLKIVAVMNGTNPGSVAAPSPDQTLIPIKLTAAGMAVFTAAIIFFNRRREASYDE